MSNLEIVLVCFSFWFLDVKPSSCPDLEQAALRFCFFCQGGAALREAVRRLMNIFKVDGLTRVLTRQLLNVYFLSFSHGFLRFLSFS